MKLYEMTYEMTYETIWICYKIDLFSASSFFFCQEQQIVTK